MCGPDAYNVRDWWVNVRVDAQGKPYVHEDDADAGDDRYLA